MFIFLYKYVILSNICERDAHEMSGLELLGCFVKLEARGAWWEWLLPASGRTKGFGSQSHLEESQR